MPWKTIDEDGGEWLRKWHTTRLQNLLRVSGTPPENLCVDELNLTVCCRYAQNLLNNREIRRYLRKHHYRQLCQLEALIENFQKKCRLPSVVAEITSDSKPRDGALGDPESGLIENKEDKGLNSAKCGELRKNLQTK